MKNNFIQTRILKKNHQTIYSLILLSALLLMLSACGSNDTAGKKANGTENEAESENLIYDCSMELQYATQFGVDYYKDGYKIITIASGDQLLVVPEGKEVPKTDEELIVIRQPLENIYMVSSSQMDLIRALGGLENVKMTGTKENDWYIDEIKKLVKDGDILYAGKYNAPDYELILSEACDLAVENTMIYHKPEVKEKIEELGIPVMVEYSSMEAHPLGRVEWIKLYGVLLDKEDEAEAFFESEISSLNGIIDTETENSAKENSVKENSVKENSAKENGAKENSVKENTAKENSVKENSIKQNMTDNDSNKLTNAGSKTVAYFYVNSRGAVNVRKSGDYIAKMIEMAGGRYLFDDLTDENALSTMNIQMEEFVEKAMEADYLVYNSSIDGKLSTIEELLSKCPEIRDSRAVKGGNVWCTEKNMFQETTGISNMILEFYYMLTGEEHDFKYMYKLK